MLKLIKFEIQRKWKYYLAALGLYELANILLILKIQSMNLVDMNMESASLGFFFLLGMVLPVLAFVDSVNTLRIEAKQPTRDLYFTLPYSGYEKIGSKLFVSGMSMMLALAGYVLTVLGSIEYLTQEPMMKPLLEAITKHFPDLSFMALITFVSYTLFIGMIYLSFGLFRSFFSQLKAGGLITLILFIAVTYLYNRYVGPLAEFNPQQTGLLPTESLHLWQSGGNVLAIQSISLAVIYALTGSLFENRVNFD